MYRCGCTYRHPRVTLRVFSREERYNNNNTANNNNNNNNNTNNNNYNTIL